MATKPLQASLSNPEQAFKSALAAVQGRRLRQKSSPIAARNQPIAPARNEQEIEKRALNDAARALAQLWKLSPNLVR